jgi:hypothetical protein
MPTTNLRPGVDPEHLRLNLMCYRTDCEYFLTIASRVWQNNTSVSTEFNEWKEHDLSVSWDRLQLAAKELAPRTWAVL